MEAMTVLAERSLSGSGIVRRNRGLYGAYFHRLRNAQIGGADAGIDSREHQGDDKQDGQKAVELAAQ